MTKSEFKRLIESKIVILDGATGSNLQKKGMHTGICPELWMIDNAEKLVDLQLEFLEAGTDILFAPTFTSNRIKLREYDLEDRVDFFNKELVDISKRAIAEYREMTGNQRRIFIAGDITLTGEMVAPHGKLSFEELVDVYKEQMTSLLSAGVDLFIIETMMSLQECRAGLLAAHELCDLPVMVSLTYEKNNRTLHGTDPITAITVLQAMGADAVGVNCSTGPDKMYDIIRQMKDIAHVPIIAKPNAGIPFLLEGQTVFPMEPEEFAGEMKKLVEYGAGIIGGCCGSTPGHIKSLVSIVKDMPVPRVNNTHYRALTTERLTIPIRLGGKFMVVGERINPTGKKALQASIREGDFSPIGDMADNQVEEGADFLDVNVGMSGIDEKEAMLKAIQEVMRVTDVPLVIDSSNPDVMEAALRIYPGRALINSISYEEDKLERLLPLAKKYGSMFILLPLSDSGLPKDIEEKKQIINRVLNKAYAMGLSKEDIIVDGLVNTVGANPNAAIDAIETIKYCKDELGVATIIGLSNISFGLPQRQFVNSTFLSFAMQAGLTMAIANPSQKLLMNTGFASDLLLGKEGAAERYINNVEEIWGKVKEAPNKPSESISDKQDKPSDKNLNLDNSKQAIFEAVLKGNKKLIIDLVEKELSINNSPSDIVDRVLIPAINEVGTLFERQKYFLPQLISSAETMKLAIDYLEPMLVDSKKDTKSKGTVIIATVAGDIHDIGKNLVALMLKNYGYRVVDLGKDVATELIISVAKDEDADIIALSALMTTTMVEMKRVVEEVKVAGLNTKVIIGGAVISQDYADEIGADGYSPDAGSAVELVKRLLS
ncbi:MAG: dihydropteroate synthase [Clostridiales bacterium]|jgi:5-methyltetrahydrofolate--homocysteine methyltransferase|nr:homocysteine S-methyltransferase family protein [Bacillota bacterium]NLK04627.1 dihydropteroate synthase [Clostridiales bacterium]